MHLVEADEYAQQLIKTIHLNPVRPKDKRKPIPIARKGELDAYPWSSHRAYAGRLKFVLGGEALWERTRELIGAAEGQEEIRWRHRVDADDVSGRVASLVEQESDRRLAIWLRVRLGGHRMTEVAAEYGYRDGSVVHQVVKRLEDACGEDLRAPGFPAELTDQEPEAAGAEVVPRQD